MSILYNRIFLSALLVIILLSQSVAVSYSQETDYNEHDPRIDQAIPDWLKTNIGWWGDGIISDREFVTSLEFLIENDIIRSPNISISEKPVALTQTGTEHQVDVEKDEDFEIVVPEWVKNNAKWWADNQIDSQSFLGGIEYLIEDKIISSPKIEVNIEESLIEDHGCSLGYVFQSNECVPYPCEQGFVFEDNTCVESNNPVGKVELIDFKWHEGLECKVDGFTAKFQIKINDKTPKDFLTEVENISPQDWNSVDDTVFGEVAIEGHDYDPVQNKVANDGTFEVNYSMLEEFEFVKFDFDHYQYDMTALKSQSLLEKFGPIDLSGQSFMFDDTKLDCPVEISGNASFEPESYKIQGEFSIKQDGRGFPANQVDLFLTNEEGTFEEAETFAITHEGNVYFEFTPGDEGKYFIWIENDWAGLPEGGNMLEVMVYENTAVVPIKYVESVEGGYVLYWYFVNPTTGEPVSNTEVKIDSFNPEKNVPGYNERVFSRNTDDYGWLIHPINNYANSELWAGDWEFTIVSIPESPLMETPKYIGGGDKLHVCLNPPTWIESAEPTCTKQESPKSVFQDSDGDGIVDELDTKPNEYSDEFEDVGDNSSYVVGKIIDRDGGEVRVWKENKIVNIFSEKNSTVEVLGVKIELEPTTVIEATFG